PLSTLAFSSLVSELRTDAAGVYSLLRQLGCATGVALMTAVLQARIQANVAALPNSDAGADRSSSYLLDAATIGAYTSCFRTMAIVTAVIVPGIFLFRILRPATVPPTAA